MKAVGKKIIVRMFIVLAIGLTGCAHHNKTVKSTLPKPIICVEEEVILRKISDTAEHIRKENIVLAKIKNASLNTPVIIERRGNIPIGEIAKKITVRYTGSIVSATKEISKKINYRHVIVGNEPANPIMVDINFANVSVYEVLEDISWQSGKQTRLIVNEVDKTLKIVFVEG